MRRSVARALRFLEAKLVEIKAVGVNDFFPFNRTELQEAEPELFQLLTEIWTSSEKPIAVSTRFFITLLVQLVEDRKLKFAVFADRTSPS